ncbi:MAG: response regulator [Anaerolineae bacterium]|nr:response regulator [Anaerolineae bacterium]
MELEHILVIDDNIVTTTKLRAMLSQIGYTVTEKNNPIDALRWLRVPGNSPDLILLDLVMPQMSGEEFVRQVRADAMINYLPIILLTGSTEVEDKVAGFEAGADDFLEKTISQTELEVRIKSLLARTQALRTRHSGPEATVISVFNLRGGVGTTSLAVNLSVALAQLAQKKIPLVDLALTHPHCPLMLNIKPENALSTLVNWDDSVMDAETIEQLLINHRTGIKLLPGTLSTIEAELVLPGVIDRVWPYLRAKYPFIVVDAGHELTETTITVLERSQKILIPLAPDLASLQAATDVIKILKKLGINPRHIQPIVNQVFPYDGLKEKFIEQILGQKIMAHIPHGRSDFIKAINTGIPVMVENPRSKVGQAIHALAHKLGANKLTDGDKSFEVPSLFTQARKLLNVT